MPERTSADGSDRWIIVSFDPSRRDTAQLKAVEQFRHSLDRLGYTALHHYAAERFVPASVGFEAEKNRIYALAPDKAVIVIIELSQAARRRCFHAIKTQRQNPADPPELLTIYT
ncbi:MAG: hypothetical protein LBB54_07575 [Cellulomonadaceae bacterium]|nr:hypothetical protein [Cellulomonadaceae bacterium]